MKQQSNRMASVARNRTRMKGAGTNTCLVTSTKALQVGTTLSDGVHRTSVSLDPMNGNAVNPSVTGIAGSYEFYRILASKVEIVPTGGSLVVGSIQTAYATNPELMVNYDLGGSGTRDNIIAREQNTQTRALCQSYTHVMSPQRKHGRQWFSCNVGLSANTDDYDRSIAAMLLLRAVYTPLTQVPCTVLFTTVYEFSGLGNTLGQTLLFNSVLDPYPVVYYNEGSEELPKQLELRQRGLPPVLYNKFVATKPSVE